jgi:hypothetical protein
VRELSDIELVGVIDHAPFLPNQPMTIQGVEAQRQHPRKQGTDGRIPQRENVEDRVEDEVSAPVHLQQPPGLVLPFEDQSVSMSTERHPTA